MNKFQRIQLVRKLNMNTEDSILVTQSTDINLMFRFILGLDSVSIRTMDPTDTMPKTPHYPIVYMRDVPNYVRQILGDGLNAIVAKPIDPNDCELAGAALKSDDHILLELAKGPCTTRKVTHDGQVDFRIEYPRRMMPGMNPAPDPRFKELIDEVKWIPLSNCTVELSYYHIPVGWKKERVIVWEITTDGTPESALALERLARQL